MKLYLGLYFLCFALLGPLFSCVAYAQAEFASLFERGQYREALIQLQKAPQYDSAYFHNMSIVYAALKQEDVARAYALKALRLQPHNANLQALLRKMNESWEKMHPSLNKAPASSAVELFFDRISEDEILGVTGLFSFFVALMWIRAYLRTRKLKESAGHPSVWIGLFILVMSYGFLAAYRISGQFPAAVLISQQVAYSGPGAQYAERGSYPAGTLFRQRGGALETRMSESWQEVRISDDEWAWIPAPALLPL